MEVLCIGYVDPFHHLPLVLQELIKFLSYGLESAKVQALQAEDKMLKKSTLEVANLPSLAYHCCFFQVQKVTGRWKLVVDLSTLDH